jgi:hypothetical protein
VTQGSPQNSAPSFPTAPRSHRYLFVFLFAASLWHIAFFAVAACLRASFPMQLEWLEGGMLDTVGRILAHKPIYVAPTHLFVPYIYTPLYYYVGALLCRITGLGFAPLRWLSTACTAGCLILIFRQTREFTGSRSAGLIAAGCFAGLYAAGGASYDLARVDMLFLVLALAAIYAVWHDQSLLAGLLFACAYQSKQAAAIIAVCVLAGTWRRPRQCATGLITFIAATVGSTLLLNRFSDGWYGFYTQWLPAHHALYPHGLFYFAVRDFGRYLLPGLLLIAWSAQPNLLQLWRSRRGNFLLFCTLGCFLAALAGRMHSGGSANVVLPLYAWFAVLFGIALSRILVASEQPRAHMQLVAALAVLQFLIMLTSPSRFIPSRAAYQQARQFLDQIAATPGDIYVIDNAADLEAAHKASFANGNAIVDVVRAGDSAAHRAMLADLQQSIQQCSYAALLAPSPLNDQHAFDGAPPDLSRYYRIDAPPLRTGEAAREIEIIQNRKIAPAYLFPARCETK